MQTESEREGKGLIQEKQARIKTLENTQGKARQGKARLRQLTGLRRVAITWRVIYAIHYSAMTERKSKAYKACVIV